MQFPVMTQLLFNVQHFGQQVVVLKCAVYKNLT